MKWIRLYTESGAPVVHSIDEFLALCQKSGETPEKGMVDKQGKTVTARRCEQEGEKIKSLEGNEVAHEGDLIVADKGGTEYAVPAANVEKYYVVDDDGNSATGDPNKWQKIPMTLAYYITPIDVQVKVPWQDEPLMATAGYALVQNDKEGKDISPVAPDVFGDDSLWKNRRQDEQVSESDDDIDIRKLLRLNGIRKFPAKTMFLSDKAKWDKDGGHAGRRTVYDMLDQVKKAGWKNGEDLGGVHPDGSTVTNSESYYSPDGGIEFSYWAHYGSTSYDNMFGFMFKLV